MTNQHQTQPPKYTVLAHFLVDYDGDLRSAVGRWPDKVDSMDEAVAKFKKSQGELNPNIEQVKLELYGDEAVGEDGTIIDDPTFFVVVNLDERAEWTEIHFEG